MIKVAVVGAFGYSGKELISLVVRHPDAEICALMDKDYIGKQYSQVYPELLGACDMPCEAYDADALAKKADVVFLALPHRVSILFARELLEKELKVIDFSGDFRLKDPGQYEKWYESKHTELSLLDDAVYGLPELYRDQIASANLIANPGCFPTASILAGYPAMKSRIVKKGAIIEAKTGVSGAGRGLSLVTHFPEANENMLSYKIGRHQHTPEIVQELSNGAGGPVQVLFTPTLVPINRGILSTVYMDLSKDVSTEMVLKIYNDFYANSPFVKVLPEGQFPQTKYTDNTNRCYLGLHVDREKKILLVISAIDNLGKGAAGQAIQNMNIMMGLEEITGLK